MKNKLITVLISIVLTSQFAVANHLGHYDLGKQCFDISYQLKTIAQLNSEDLCAGDVTVASSYIESTARELLYGRNKKALVTLAYGQNELKEISNVRSYCAYLSSEVRSYLAKVILIKNELENATSSDTDQTSD